MKMKEQYFTVCVIKDGKRSNSVNFTVRKSNAKKLFL